MKRIYDYFTPFERALWLSSAGLIILSAVLFLPRQERRISLRDRRDILFLCLTDHAVLSFLALPGQSIAQKAAFVASSARRPPVFPWFHNGKRQNLPALPSRL